MISNPLLVRTASRFITSPAEQLLRNQINRVGPDGERDPRDLAVECGTIFDPNLFRICVEDYVSKSIADALTPLRLDIAPGGVAALPFEAVSFSQIAFTPKKS